MFRIPKVTALCICFAVTLSVQGVASAASLDSAAKRLADCVARYLKGSKQVAIQVNAFKGPPDSGTGRTIQMALRNELKALDINCNPKTPNMKVGGKFRVGVEDGRTFVLISATMVNRDGNEVAEFRNLFEEEPTPEVDVEEEVALLLGANVDFTSNLRGPAILDERTRRLTQSVNAPVANVFDDTVVSARKESKYKLEIHVRQSGETTYKPRKIVLEDGMPFVDLQLKDEFAIVMHNKSEHDVGARIAIDGINMFEFSEVESYRELGMVLVRGDSAGAVYGWHGTNDKSDAFRITELPGSEAAKLGRDTSETGTITLNVFPAWSGTDVHPGELLGAPRSSSTGLGVERGAQIKSRFTEVKRHFGATLLTTLTVRYSRPGTDALPSGQ